MAEKNTVDNVSVGKPKVGGAVFIAPVGEGTTIPTDATTPLGEEFENVGFISEDGVTNEVETDSEEIKAWGGDIVATPQTSRSEKFGFTMIETNETSLKVVYGKDNVSVAPDTGAITVKHNGNEREEYVVVIETLFGKDRVRRQVVPRGKVLEIGEIVFKDDEPVGYETSISALMDKDGNTAYTYIGKVAAA